MRPLGWQIVTRSYDLKLHGRKICVGKAMKEKGYTEYVYPANHIPHARDESYGSRFGIAETASVPKHADEGMTTDVIPNQLRGYIRCDPSAIWGSERICPPPLKEDENLHRIELK